MTNYTEEEIVQQTKNWVAKVVVGLNFCPFAKREVLRDSIRYHVSNKDSLEEVLEELVRELNYLDKNVTTETTLLIYPKLFEDFESYLDLVDMGQSFLDQLNYEGIYQLASFHPQYQFGGTTLDDASNYTNRSPYPTLHIIREESIERALEHYEAPEEIPERNIQVAEEMGAKVLQQLLLDCYQL
ncbi:DUF1415 domain-containing protein [Aureispira sp. CCB-E]|uniref:DUF1415 domain-containing protein n=1 Tax=Aureispira sp. CCB-E TaxID=3051121 RepID=UPI002868D3E8|nr:DUF1415 domain-containing protein [Aureispira sp. CCB-E]WMX16874.1 DUF1415 domain-containing protein [Aureispira sp. CCB-E]